MNFYDVCCRDHAFDSNEARHGKPKRKSGTIHGAMQASRGMLGVRKFFKLNEGLIPAHKRENIDI